MEIHRQFRRIGQGDGVARAGAGRGGKIGGGLGGGVGRMDNIGAVDADQPIEIGTAERQPGKTADHGLLFAEGGRSGGARRRQRLGAIADLVAGIGERTEHGRPGIEQGDGIASVAARQIALQIGRRIALQEDGVARRGAVFEIAGRGESADAEGPGRQSIIFHIDRLDVTGGFGAAAAAEIEIGVVGPVAEHLAADAQIDAAEIGAIGKIGRIGSGQQIGDMALAVKGGVKLHQQAHRGAEAAIGGGDLQPAIVDAGLVLAAAQGGDLVVEIGILVRGAALEIGQRRAGVATGLALLVGLGALQLLNLVVEVGNRALQRLDVGAGVRFWTAAAKAGAPSNVSAAPARRKLRNETVICDDPLLRRAA